jgi:CheY-like chemotaxis protein
MLLKNDVSRYLKGARILLIDDSMPFQRLMSEVLGNCGVASVVTASTLNEGLHYMRYQGNQKESDVPEYDLILMDVNLPDGNGMVGCHFISSHATTYNIPVVVITGTSSPETLRQALHAGASDFLQKPIIGEQLKLRLGLLLKLKVMEQGVKNDNLDFYFHHHGDVTDDDKASDTLQINTA